RTAPPGGATVSQTITVSAAASDNLAVAGVQFKLDGLKLGADDTTTPYPVSWNTPTAATGPHTLTAVARDAAGNASTTSVAVTVANDLTPPTVSITAPLGGTTVSGTVTIAANASDDVGVVGVQFKLDGANLGAEVTTAPYTMSWDTAPAAIGAHTLTAVARDAAGNTATSAPSSVTVDNEAPLISAVSSSSIGSSSATISWTTDGAADSQVENGPTTAYGNLTSLDPSLVTAHA